MADSNTPKTPTVASTQNNVADASIKNFLKGVKFPPTTVADREKMKAAIEAFKAEVKKTKEVVAKKAGDAGKSGPVVSKALAAQQTTKVGNSVQDLAKFLPAGTNTNNITFDAAINSMESAIKQLETLTKAPAAAIDTASSAIANAANQVQNLSTVGQAQIVAQSAAAEAAQIQAQKTVGGANAETLEDRAAVRNV